MEVLGVASGIIAVQIIGKVTLLGYEYILLMRELTSLSQVLIALRDYTDKCAPGPTILQTLNTQLLECTIELQTLVTKLRGRRRNKWGMVMSSLKWPLKDTETSQFMESIERHKSIFMIALSTDYISLSKSIEGQVKGVGYSVMATVKSATLDQYRLETEFDGDNVIHTTWEPDLVAEHLDMKVRVERRWSYECMISSGIGTIMREKDERGQFRVVKRLNRSFLINHKIDVTRELNILVKLKDHPKSFIQFSGWYENDDYIFIVMEDAQYGDLDQYLEHSGPAAKLKAKEITRQLLVGLDLLHKQNICHRDIKPQNILIAATSPIWVKIAGFGVLKQEQDTMLRTYCGTHKYTAPEIQGFMPRLRRRYGRPTGYTNAADLWSLGALVHKILTLEEPFLEQRPTGYTNAVDLWSLGVLVHKILTLEEPLLKQFSDDDDSGSVSCIFEYFLDAVLLVDYCCGRVGFPTGSLERSKVSRSGIEFVKKLMTADPQSRMSAADALCSRWLSKETPQERLLQAEPYKLQTTINGDNVIHTTYKLDPTGGKRNIEVKSKWTRKRDIGQGMFGVVYLEEEETGKYRAVKKLARTKDTGDYSRELSLLAKLADHHDLFVQFLGWYENEHSIFVAMEYMEHGDLSKHLGNSSIKKDAKEITRQLLRGLAVLHEHSICHRDLKPQNVLIARTEPIWVKIADFGISKDGRETFLQTRCGTPAYLAPEVHLRGRPYTNAVDIWALGCLLYQILTSETPFLRTSSDSAMSENESGVLCTSPSRELDIGLLADFYNGKKDFPIDVLKKCDTDDEAIVFLKRLIVANPNSRMSATDALQSPWLLGGSGPSPQKDHQRAGDSKTSSIEGALQELSTEVKNMQLGLVRNPPKKESVRFSADENFWSPELRQLIKYTSAQIHKAPDNNGRGLLIDPIPSNGRNNSTKRIFQGVWELVWKLIQITQSVDSMTFGIPVCAGIINAKGSNGTPSGINMVFQVPGNLVNPRSLRSILLSPDHKDNFVGTRIQLAKYLTRSVLFLDSINFVHKEIRPENIIIFDSSEVGRMASESDQARFPFLIGFRGFNTYGGPTQAIDPENIYRHPDCQSQFPESQYNMKHDIYSLGVCLLEIALWKSFVCYDENESPRISAEFLAKLGIAPQPESLNYPAAYQVKEMLVKMAREMIPETLGDQYAEVTISCLRVLGGENDNENEDDDDGDDDDDDHLFSEEEISISDSYTNEVLRKMEEIIA